MRKDIDVLRSARDHPRQDQCCSTANDDLEYDRIANTLSQEQAALGRRLDVQVWGWDTLQPKIRANKAALDAFDPPPFDRGGKAVRDRNAQVGPAQSDACYPPAGHPACKTPADRLHFWQFGHVA